MRSFFALFLVGLIAGCSPTPTATNFKSMSNSLLWSKHYTVSDPLELALIEAELGEPPHLDWSTVKFRKRRTENGEQATQARGNSSEAAAG